MNDTTIRSVTETSATEIQASPTADGSLAPPRLGITMLDVASLTIVAVAVGLSYYPNIASLVKIWNREPEYTHGFLVLPIAIAILWMRWPRNLEARPAPWAFGWLMVLATLAARVYFHERNQTWSENASIVPLITGLALARVGWRPMLKVWPAFAFLVFLLPLPPALNAILSQPLQSSATKASCFLLRLSGLWVIPEGNVIQVGNDKLEVAEACNGLSMLMSLAATVAATVSLFPMSTWKRFGLMAFIIPIALTCNILRITVTAWSYKAFGAAIVHDYIHDWAGWAMMPLAMLMVYLLYRGMSWVILESSETTREGGMVPLIARQAWTPAGRS